MASIRKKVRLMVVDEHESYCELLRHSIEIASFNYEIVPLFLNNAQDALHKIQSFEPNVIIVDAHISDMNCVDFINKCREGLAPLVVTSQYISSDTEETMIAKGARAYFAKSEDPDEIEFLIERLACIATEQNSLH